MINISREDIETVASLHDMLHLVYDLSLCSKELQDARKLMLKMSIVCDRLDKE